MPLSKVPSQLPQNPLGPGRCSKVFPVPPLLPSVPSQNPLRWQLPGKPWLGCRLHFIAKINDRIRGLKTHSPWPWLRFWKCGPVEAHSHRAAHTQTQRKAQTHVRLLLGLWVTCQPRLLPPISGRALQGSCCLAEGGRAASELCFLSTPSSVLLPAPELITFLQKLKILGKSEIASWPTHCTLWSCCSSTFQLEQKSF